MRYIIFIIIILISFVKKKESQEVPGSKQIERNNEVSSRYGKYLLLILIAFRLIFNYKNIFSRILFKCFLLIEI
jgi:hypothetical protein